MRRIYAAFYILAASVPLAAASAPVLTTIYTFSGATPLGLSSGKNGVLYGAASGYGICGLVFELQPPSAPGGAWTETTLHTFGGVPDGCNPVGAPVAAANGALYGLSYGGAYNNGAVYELQPPAAPGGSWSETVLYSFSLAVGPYEGGPTGMVLGPGGVIYVTTGAGGTGGGALIELGPPASPGGAWTPSLLYGFGVAGSFPTSLIAGPGGRFYGTTKYGGGGTIFELRPPATAGGAWTEKLLFYFDGQDGFHPNPVTLAPNGSLYGSAWDGPPGGPVFQLSPPSSPGEAWSQTILATFGISSCGPDSPLVVRNGNVYGSSCLSDGRSVVFELQPPAAPGGPWTNIPLSTFAIPAPTGSLVVTEDGTVYGTTSNIDANDGTVYRITTQ